MLARKGGNLERRLGPNAATPRRGLKRPREAGVHAKPAQASKCNSIRAKPQREHRNTTEFVRNRVETMDPSHRARVAVGNLSGPPRRGLNLKRPREVGIRGKLQWEHRNATQFARNHSGRIEKQRNLLEASKPRSRPPRRGLKRPEFVRNHSGSIEMQRNSRETTAGASKPRPRLTARAVAVGQPKWPPQNRPEEATRGLNSRETAAGASKCNGILRAKPQREHRNATDFARNHSGSVETKDPSHRARRCGRQPKWPPRRGLNLKTRGRNSRQATVGASKCNAIRAKPQRQHRKATEFARSVETKAPIKIE